MSATVQELFTGTLQDVTLGDRKIWRWILAVGIVQILVGILAVSFSFSATIVSVVTLGILLLAGAVGQTVAAILARDWGGFFLFLLLGIFYAVAGVLSIQHPLLAAEGLTLMLAAVYLVGGIARIISACVDQIHSRGWVLCNGIMSVLLGVLIWQQWPMSGLWVLGLFIGIDMIVNGATWSMLALRSRNGKSQLSDNSGSRRAINTIG